ESNEKEFLEILQKGVAHAKGTVFPGDLGNIYLFAHSTDNFWDVGRYNAVFYLLKDLAKGDDVVVFFQDRRHNYVVSETIIADPQDVSYLVNGQETGEEKLILQTCWPPGTTWKRLIVIARPK
ncbi:MAG: sortase, partial [Patescibacteria group bacterium]|nr:sortase [Patescibacteria group bacterium]